MREWLRLYWHHALFAITAIGVLGLAGFLVWAGLDPSSRMVCLDEDELLVSRGKHTIQPESGKPHACFVCRMRSPDLILSSRGKRTIGPWPAKPIARAKPSDTRRE